MEMLGEKKVYEIMRRRDFKMPESITDVMMSHMAKWTSEEQGHFTSINADKINAMISDYIFMGAIECVHLQNGRSKHTPAKAGGNAGGGDE